MANETKLFGLTRAPNALHQQVHRAFKRVAETTLTLDQTSNHDGNGALKPESVLLNLTKASVRTALNGGILGLRAGNWYRSGAKWVVGRGQRMPEGESREQRLQVDHWGALTDTATLKQNGVLGVVAKRLGAALSVGIATWVNGVEQAPAADLVAQKVINKVNDVLRLPLVHGPAIASCAVGAAVGTALGVAGFTVIGAALAGTWLCVTAFHAIKNAITQAAQDANRGTFGRAPQADTEAATKAPQARASAGPKLTRRSSLATFKPTPLSTIAEGDESAPRRLETDAVSLPAAEPKQADSAEQPPPTATPAESDAVHAKTAATTPAESDAVSAPAAAEPTLALAAQAASPENLQPWQWPDAGKYSGLAFLKLLAQEVRNGAPVSPGAVELRAIAHATGTNFRLEGDTARKETDENCPPFFKVRRSEDGAWEWSATHKYDYNPQRALPPQAELHAQVPPTPYKRAATPAGERDNFYACIAEALAHSDRHHTCQSLRKTAAGQLEKIIDDAICAPQSGPVESYLREAYTGMSAPQPMARASQPPASADKVLALHSPVPPTISVGGEKFPHPLLEAPAQVAAFYADRGKDVNSHHMAGRLEAEALATKLQRRIVLWSRDQGPDGTVAQICEPKIPSEAARREAPIHIIHDKSLAHWSQFIPNLGGRQASLYEVCSGKTVDCGSGGNNSCMYLSIYGKRMRHKSPEQRKLIAVLREMAAEELSENPGFYQDALKGEAWDKVNKFAREKPDAPLNADQEVFIADARQYLNAMVEAHQASIRA